MKRNGGKNATGSFLTNRKCSTCSGQPSMAKGNKAEENHVSRTSGSGPGQAHMGEKDASITPRPTDEFKGNRVNCSNHGSTLLHPEST